MYLFSLIILFALLGYILANTRFNRRVDAVTDEITSIYAQFTGWLGGIWNKLFRRAKDGDEFRRWALGVGARLLPDDLKTWLVGLPEEEARKFHHSLAEYSDSLGFRLSELLDGSLDRDPYMRQVFVEAIVVYSPAYRKARQVQREAAENDQPSKQADDEKLPAEKAPSRRKQSGMNGKPAAEAVEANPAA